MLAYHTLYCRNLARQIEPTDKTVFFHLNLGEQQCRIKVGVIDAAALGPFVK